MSRKVLVAYASKMGSTAEIAAAIGAELRAAGHDVTVRDAAEIRSITSYDAVVLGSAIYARRWRPDAVRFLRRHVEELRERHVWLFHSGPVGPDKDEAQTMPPKVARLAEKIGTSPATTFAGRLEPATAKGWLARRLARGDMAADSRDWDKIAAWADEIAIAMSATEIADQHPDDEEAY
ncbi:menaquinone-dependent protoporphyrinogen oxidase [Kribbella orskensis]|uniref:Menaquinone-dependent protoporphyrinogen oxidase n=1 Tax=Kribbella orskensis TaxID=2512216 RepID=A0ABY2BAJ9_9ACTN|nr:MULTISPECIES: flavodoxin domain-containing protein [Kribbella]TCN31157.1 menaquinone-dependent protoporphyrinogen oxidase [Kribbella sp. VKM Ac-2500]TCO11663.1 menaquinone-dependent protoporphyrinogen oxidase [Kribbella orskensis]